MRWLNIIGTQLKRLTSSMTTTLVLLVILTVSALAHAVTRPWLKTDEILNESASKKPGSVQLSRRTVTATTSVALTDLSSANEVFIQNKYDTDLCIKVAGAGETCTATCTGSYIRLEQDEAITVPIPRGTSSDSGSASSYGSYCGIMASAPTNSKAIQTVERN